MSEANGNKNHLRDHRLLLLFKILYLYLELVHKSFPFMRFGTAWSRPGERRTFDAIPDSDIDMLCRNIQMEHHMDRIHSFACPFFPINKLLAYYSYSFCLPGTKNSIFNEFWVWVLCLAAPTFTFLPMKRLGLLPFRLRWLFFRRIDPNAGKKEKDLNPTEAANRD